MPTWHAPFHGPKVSTVEFLKRRDDYVAKYGYKYSIPGFDNIVHLGFEKDISLKEEEIWKRKAYSELGPGRFDQIKYMKNERKLRYLNMLASPQPQVFRNRGALMGSIDDAQDAISTVVCLASIIIKALPASIGGLLMGPLTWLMGASEILNLSMKYIAPEQRLVSQKRLHDAITDENPFSKKARLKHAKKIAKAGFGFGDILQGAQVTKDIFGIGLCLGSLMNVPLDIITGAARAALGQKVEVTYPVPDFSIWWQRILKAGKAMLMSMGMPPNPETRLYAQLLILFNLIGQVATPENMGYDPIETVPEIAHVQILPPQPTHFLTREIIQEIDPGGFEAVGWPSTGEKWSTLNDIAITAAPQITANYQDFCWKNKRNWMGYVAANCATQGTMYALENAEGPGSVEYDYTASTKICHALLYMNMHFPQDLADWQRARMISWLEAHDAAGTTPTLPEVVAYAQVVCGFEFFVGPYPSTVRFKAFGLNKALTYTGIFDTPKTQVYPTVPKEFTDQWEKQARSPKNPEV